MTYSLVWDVRLGAASPDCVRRDADGALVPNDPDNMDWRAYRDWRDGGGEPAPAVAAPTPPAPLGFLEFMDLFTTAEQGALVTSADPRVKLFLLQASGAGAISFADPRVAAALDQLTTLGLLAAGRAAQILANGAPS